MTAPRSALEAATAALAQRDRSAASLVRYLEQRGAAPEDASHAVERLAAAGYVDDARFALRRAEVLAERGQGDEAIRFALAKDGVGAEEVDAALAALAPERERALAALQRAKTPLAGARRLAAKGFSADAIESALAALPREEVTR
jgi:regulatory protein